LKGFGLSDIDISDPGYYAGKIRKLKRMATGSSISERIDGLRAPH